MEVAVDSDRKIEDGVDESGLIGGYSCDCERESKLNPIYLIGKFIKL
jgi:hypothetical protein